MSNTTLAFVAAAFVSQFVSACASPQLVNYQLTESTPRYHSELPHDYLPKIVVKESGKRRAENHYIDMRYY